MSANTEKLLRMAMELPPDARAALAGILLDSLDGELDPGAEYQWGDEIQERLRELDEGLVSTVPWAVARRAILGNR